MTLWKDLIDIPESSETFVHTLSSGLDSRQRTVDSYVVTETLADRFDEALTMIRSGLAVDSPAEPTSKGSFLHGSFGSGKSHFMTVLGLLLDDFTPARELSNLAGVVEKHRNWMDRSNLLKVPLHLLGADSIEQGVFGGYVDFIEENHPDAPLPGIYVADRVLENARSLREKMGDEQFFDTLNEGSSGGGGWGDFQAQWDADSFDRAVAAGPDDEQKEKLIGDVVEKLLPSVKDKAAASAEGFVTFDKGLSILSRHAKDLGYDGVILFLDEIILWLSRRAAEEDFVNRELQKVPKLVEAQHGDRPAPIFSFLARQRDLSEMIGEVFRGEQQTSLNLSQEWSSGRFGTIELEDRNLPHVANKRLLEPKNTASGEQIRHSFNKVFEDLDSKKREIMQTSRYDRDDFERVYPFSPALMRVLVVLSNELQRDRTALKIMQMMLIDQRDRLELGEIIPVGDLWPYLARGDDPFDPVMKRLFRSAKDLYEQRLIPMLEHEHDVDHDEIEPGDEGWEAYNNDLRILHTLLVAALVPNLEIFENLTAEKLLALNHGTITAPVPGAEKSQLMGKLRNWATDVGQIHLTDAPNRQVELRLEGVDLEPLMEKAATADNQGTRRRMAKELLYDWMELEEGKDLGATLTLPWKGDDRNLDITYRNIREQSPDQLEPIGDDPLLVVDYPFDPGTYSARDDEIRIDDFLEEREPVNSVAWLPTFLSDEGRNVLSKLVRIEDILKRFGDYAKNLSPDDKPVARRQLESNRDTLRSRLNDAFHTAYGMNKADERLLDQSYTPKHLRALDPDFDPEVPFGASFRKALERIARQTFEYVYPNAFDLPDERLRPSQVASIHEVIRGAIDSVENSYRVDESRTRALMREFAQPLKLGTMGDTRFSFDDHWVIEFERNLDMSKADGDGLPVADAYDYLDPADNRTGLPTLLQDLIILSVADAEDMAVERRGGALSEVSPGDLRSDDKLVQHDLPSEEDWQKVRKIAETVFSDLDAPRMRNARSVQRLGADLAKAAESNSVAARQLADTLERVATNHLGMSRDEVRDSLRWEISDRLAGLIDALEKQDMTDRLNAVAQLQVDDDDASRMKASFERAQKNLEVLTQTRWQLFDKVLEGAKAGKPGYEPPIKEAQSVLSASEVGQSLAQLKEIENRLVDLAFDTEPDDEDEPTQPTNDTQRRQESFSTERTRAVDAVSDWLQDALDEIDGDDVTIDITVTDASS